MESEAHQAGLTTADFALVVDKMTEFARVLAAQPTPPSPPQQPSVPQSGPVSTEIRINPTDRLEPVTVKKRSILGALGFFERAYNLVGSTATLAGTAQGGRILEALKTAIESLWGLIR